MPRNPANKHTENPFYNKVSTEDEQVIVTVNAIYAIV